MLGQRLHGIRKVKASSGRRNCAVRMSVWHDPGLALPQPISLLLV
jgi:hypothetical protein